MKIIYILKKGFHCYPPCLAQLLYLDDLNIELEVYHGKNSPAVDEILDARGIVHHTLESDRTNRSTLARYKTQLAYTREIRKIIARVPQDSVLWFGNCESVLTVGGVLDSRRFVLSVLELYDADSIYGRLLGKIIHRAETVICCEKHRAAIMQVYYGLRMQPCVMPNKPYEFVTEQKEDSLAAETREKLAVLKDKFFVLYQGGVTEDRPLDKVADALRMLDEDIYFVILGKAEEKIQQELLARYEKTVFLGYVPSPQHLLVTQYAGIGIANYDYSCLNNQFCAPNKIYEYAKFGVPILASCNIGLTETVGRQNAAICIDFSDAKQIAEGISMIREKKLFYADNAVAFYNGTDNRTVMREIVERLAENAADGI